MMIYLLENYEFRMCETEYSHYRFYPSRKLITELNGIFLIPEKFSDSCAEYHASFELKNNVLMISTDAFNQKKTLWKVKSLREDAIISEEITLCSENGAEVVLHLSSIQ